MLNIFIFSEQTAFFSLTSVVVGVAKKQIFEIHNRNPEISTIFIESRFWQYESFLCIRAASVSKLLEIH